MAAVLSCGSEALLSHRSAADLWGILPTSSARIDVTAPRTSSGRPGITLHRPRRVHPEDRAANDRIPVTSIARTLLDLADVVGAHRLGRAVNEAERLQVFDLRAVMRLVARSRGRRGLPLLEAVLSDYRGPPPATRSELERRFLDLCREAGLPRPQVNAFVCGFQVDMVWHEGRLVVELDGYAFHRTRGKFEDDRERDAILQLAAYRVVRFTYRRLEDEPAEVMRIVRSLLSRSPERRGGVPGACARARPGAPAW